MPSNPRHPTPEPPTQTPYLPGNLIDLNVTPDNLIAAALTNTLTLKDITHLAIALDDVTTCLRWLLEHPDSHHTHALRNEFAQPEYRTPPPKPSRENP